MDDREKTLAERWNLAMTRAGFAGSEYIDEPEFVAERVRELKDAFHEQRRTNHTLMVRIRALEAELRAVSVAWRRG